MTHSIAIRLSNISKKYSLRKDKPTLIESLHPFQQNHKFIALNKINLTIYKGERICITGPNGAGKTTLLRLVSGITKPTTGSIKINGRIVSLIELSAGFHSQLNGFDNININGLILGLTRKEIKEKIHSIIQYANIGDFIHQPLYTYSSGMILRLSVAVLFHIPADIYVLDENLFVGDYEFNRQIYTSLQTFIKQKKTIIIATHQTTYIESICNRFITIDNGHLLHRTSYKEFTPPPRHH